MQQHEADVEITMRNSDLQDRLFATHLDGHKQGGIDAIEITLSVIEESSGTWSVEDIVQLLRDALTSIKSTP